MNLERNELISICEDAVVSCTEWTDRDSASAQSNVSELYSRFKAGINFTAKIEGETIWVQFESPTKEQKDLLLSNYLPIDSVEDYREKVDPDYEDEMFEPGMPDVYTDLHGYLPTRERLVIDGDWY